jgi:predicted AlkP superfamily phosphohydrolase/phosphomutase
MDKDRSPIMIIGVDGATFSYLDLHLSADHTPNLFEMSRDGLRADLLSVTPPMTPVAWTSMMTGVGPDAHGIHGWFDSLRQSYSLRPVSHRNVRYKPLWTLLSESGSTVGVAHVPLTYPPAKVRGFFISGFDSPFSIPEWSENISWPTTLLQEIREQGIDYKLIELLDPESSDPISDPAYYFGRRLEDFDLKEHLNSWGEVERNHARAFAKLIERFQPEFMMIHFHIIDYFAHRSLASSDLMAQAFRYLDACIGDLRASSPPETRFLIVSDHGVAEIRSLFFVHNWLRDNGYLTFKKDIADIMLPVIADRFLKLSSLPISRKEMSSYVEQFVRDWQHVPNEIRETLVKQLKPMYPGCDISHNNIDWSNTRVFTTSPYGQLYFNLEEFYPQGLVRTGDEYLSLADEVIQKLSELRDLEGQPYILHAMRGKDFYKQFKLGEAPDVVYFPRDYSCYCDHLYPHYLFESKWFGKRELIDGRFAAPHYGYVGDHKPQGLFIAYGPDISKTTPPETISILDIAPTVLHMLNKPIPTYMEGNVINLWTSLSAPPLYESVEGRVPFTASPSDEALDILRVLRSLGYKL